MYITPNYEWKNEAKIFLNTQKLEVEIDFDVKLDYCHQRSKFCVCPVFVIFSRIYNP